MARSSRADTARHHQELIDAAARLFRQRGVESVSVPDVMGEIGLTRGGFYKHFESKDALVTAAVEAAFREHRERLGSMSDEHAQDRARTRQAFVDFCLSAAHRDDPGNGCPSSLATAIAQSDPGGAPRAAFVEGMRTFLDELAEQADEGDDSGADQDRVLGDLATIVGAVLLARATTGDPLSDDILAAARRRLDR